MGVHAPACMPSYDSGFKLLQRLPLAWSPMAPSDLLRICYQLGTKNSVSGQDSVKILTKTRTFRGHSLKIIVNPHEKNETSESGKVPLGARVSIIISECFFFKFFVCQLVVIGVVHPNNSFFLLIFPSHAWFVYTSHVEDKPTTTPHHTSSQPCC